MTTGVTRAPHTLLPAPRIVIVTPHVLGTGHQGEGAQQYL